MVHSTRTVLIVDDSAAIRRELSEEFIRSGFAFCEAESGSEAIERVRALPPDLIILDLSMPVMNGLEAAPRLREILPQVPIILYTAFADAVRVTDFHASGVTTVFPKSDPLTTLIATAKKLLDHD